MQKPQSTGFIIWDFMIRDLGLGGVPLLVYALIYSFSRAGQECYGSKEYIAERVGSCLTSVKSALRLLLDRGLIVKEDQEEYKSKIYRAKIDPPGQNLPGRKCPLTGQNPTAWGAEIDPNNKENNKEITTTTLVNYINSNGVNAEERIERLIPFGKENLVQMTTRQYIDLVHKIGAESLRRYVERMERLIINGGDFIKNHYKTILQWAREDVALE